MSSSMLAWINEHHFTIAETAPFPHFVLKDFFIAEKFAKVKAALLSQKFEKRRSDLFLFSQCMLEDPVLKEFLEFLGSPEFMAYVMELTGVTGLHHIDATGFCYEDGNYLLPHDDRMPGRKVAYIVNFSDLEENGQLDLFSGNKVVKSYSPSANSIVLFPVGETLHQVREVIDAKRYTIAGWFYGP